MQLRLAQKRPAPQRRPVNLKGVERTCLMSHNPRKRAIAAGRILTNHAAARQMNRRERRPRREIFRDFSIHRHRRSRTYIVCQHLLTGVLTGAQEVAEWQFICGKLPLACCSRPEITSEHYAAPSEAQVYL
jgi:hypothetical protein